jgi:hypothetical protein
MTKQMWRISEVEISSGGNATYRRKTVGVFENTGYKPPSYRNFLIGIPG